MIGSRQKGSFQSTQMNANKLYPMVNPGQTSWRWQDWTSKRTVNAPWQAATSWVCQCCSLTRESTQWILAPSFSPLLCLCLWKKRLNSYLILSPHQRLETLVCISWFQLSDNELWPEGLLSLRTVESLWAERSDRPRKYRELVIPKVHYGLEIAPAIQAAMFTVWEVVHASRSPYPSISSGYVPRPPFDAWNIDSTKPYILLFSYTYIPVIKFNL